MKVIENMILDIGTVLIITLGVIGLLSLLLCAQSFVDAFKVYP